MARPEQSISPNPMQELPKGEVVFSRQLTLRELLGIKPGEEGETRDLLNDAPFSIEIWDLGNSVLRVASFSEAQPVGPLELFSLLKVAKPGGSSREGQNIAGIFNDWRIILPEVREKEPRSRQLYDFHKKYVPEFSEFEANHFELFWKVLESGYRREQESTFFDLQLRQFIDEREFFAKYGREGDFSNDQRIEFLAMNHSENFRQFLEKKGFNIPSSIQPPLNFLYHETAMVFGSMDEQKRRALATEFHKEEIGREGIELERKLGEYLRWDGTYCVRTTLIGEGGTLHRINANGALISLDESLREGNRHISDPDSFTRLDNGHTEITKGGSSIRISIFEGEDGYKKAKLEDQHLSPEETMVPLIVWQTDKKTGKRYYYCGKFYQLSRHDTLLGQLVVAAYSPKARDQMPKAYTMRDEDGNHIKQNMLEAQAVLMVPRFSNTFLTQSPVISGLEALAGN